MAIVEFKNVSRIYQSGDHELKALDNVSMNRDEGKFVVTHGMERYFSVLWYFTISEL